MFDELDISGNTSTWSIAYIFIFSLLESTNSDKNKLVFTTKNNLHILVMIIDIVYLMCESGSLLVDCVTLISIGCLSSPLFFLKFILLYRISHHIVITNL